MTDETLNELLRRLREHLDTTGVEPQSRDDLARTVRDISARLEADQAPVAAAPVSAGARVASESRAESTELRLEELAVRFEAKHPAIAQLLRQLGTLLGQAGI